MWIDDLNPSKISFAGDWHGNERYANKQIVSLHERGVKVIVHVGDFAPTMNKRYLDSLQKTLTAFDMYIVWVDGNHEHYHLLYTYEIVDGVRPVRERVIHLPRGYRWEWSGVKFLALGGAHSVDKLYRTPGADWWPEEHITYEEAELAATGGYADVMVTHDCPSGFMIQGIDDRPPGDNGGWPESMIMASGHHRDVLQSVVDEVKPNRLVCGHYHRRLTGLLKGEDYSTVVDILNADIGPWMENFMIFDL